MAREQNLDLVLVAPQSKPPICKFMNYGKYKFEMAKKEKEAKKKQKVAEIKEIRIGPNIEQHDFEFKVKNAKKFIENGNKVRITMRFRGREMNYTKQGEENFLKFEHELKDIATAENKPVLMGRNMFLTLIPKNESKK